MAAPSVWFYRPQLHWYGWRTLLPIEYGHDENARRTLVLGWTITGMVCISLWGCGEAECEQYAAMESLDDLVDRGILSTFDSQHWCNPSCESGCDIKTMRTWTRTEVVERERVDTAIVARAAARYFDTQRRLHEGDQEMLDALAKQEGALDAS